jgi:hypothetical protein
MPFPIILLWPLLVKAILGAGLIAIVVAVLCFEQIRNWLSSRAPKYKLDEGAVGFSLQKKLANNEYTHVYGVFDTNTNKVLEAEAVTSNDIDEDLRSMHSEALVIFPRS